MADDRAQDDEGPSLELPSLFRRRKKPDPVAEPPEKPAPPAPEPPVEPDPEPTVVLPEPSPADPPAASADSAPPSGPEAPARPGRRGLRERLERLRGPALDDRPDPGPESTPVGSVEPPRVRPIEPRVTPAADQPTAPEPPGPPGVPLSDRVRAGIPAMAASTAAVVVGAVVGLLGCVATWVGLQGCEALTGAQTCGGPGLLVLVAIVVCQIVLGAVLLKLLGVPEAGNLSFLGVGLMVVVALLVLIDHLYDAWMFVAIPVVTAATFGVARWITTKYADDTHDYPAEQHDIR